MTIYEYSSFTPFYSLFSFIAVTAGTAAFRAGIAYVDLSKGTIIALAVVLTFGNAATDCSVYVFGLIHHNFSLLLGNFSMGIFQKNIDNLKKLLYNNKKGGYANESFIISGRKTLR